MKRIFRNLGDRPRRAKRDVYPPREPSRDEIWAGFKKILSRPPSPAASKTRSFRSSRTSDPYDDPTIPNPLQGRPEPSSYPLDSAVIELAVMMAHTYRATLKNCHYIQMLVQNFVGVAAGHGEVDKFVIPFKLADQDQFKPWAVDLLDGIYRSYIFHIHVTLQV